MNDIIRPVFPELFFRPEAVRHGTGHDAGGFARAHVRGPVAHDHRAILCHADIVEYLQDRIRSGFERQAVISADDHSEVLSDAQLIEKGFGKFPGLVRDDGHGEGLEIFKGLPDRRVERCADNKVPAVMLKVYGGSVPYRAGLPAERAGQQHFETVTDIAAHGLDRQRTAAQPSQGMIYGNRDILQGVRKRSVEIEYKKTDRLSAHMTHHSGLRFPRSLVTRLLTRDSFADYPKQTEAPAPEARRARPGSLSHRTGKSRFPEGSLPVPVWGRFPTRAL